MTEIWPGQERMAKRVYAGARLPRIGSITEIWPGHRRIALKGCVDKRPIKKGENKMDIEAMRKSSDAKERKKAFQLDREQCRDISWARRDNDANVRLQAAWSDRENNRDMAWARADSAADKEGGK